MDLALDNGLFKVDLYNNSIINYKSDSNKYSLPSDSVRAICMMLQVIYG